MKVKIPLVHIKLKSLMRKEKCRNYTRILNRKNIKIINTKILPFKTFLLHPFDLELNQFLFKIFKFLKACANAQSSRDAMLKTQF